MDTNLTFNEGDGDFLIVIKLILRSSVFVSLIVTKLIRRSRLLVTSIDSCLINHKLIVRIAHLKVENENFLSHQFKSGSWDFFNFFFIIFIVVSAIYVQF